MGFVGIVSNDTFPMILFFLTEIAGSFLILCKCPFVQGREHVM